MSAQLDLFDLLDTQPLQPFTVHTGPGSIDRAINRCGYCGKDCLPMGGGGSPARGDKPSYWYSYCGPCVERHGHPKPWADNWVLVAA